MKESLKFCIITVLAEEINLPEALLNLRAINNN